MKNDYEIRGNITAIFLKRKDGTVLETIIDTVDLDKANEYEGKWFACRANFENIFYVHGHIRGKDGKRITISLHRFLMNAKELLIDHKNHNSLDNRRSVNLREGTKQQNAQNRNGEQRNSKSGIRGVCWSVEKKKWRSNIRINRKQTHLGYFSDIFEAESIVIEARKKYMPFSHEALAEIAGAFNL